MLKDPPQALTISTKRVETRRGLGDFPFLVPTRYFVGIGKGDRRDGSIKCDWGYYSLYLTR
jgi:hypothetical protein